MINQSPRIDLSLGRIDVLELGTIHKDPKLTCNLGISRIHHLHEQNCGVLSFVLSRVDPFEKKNQNPYFWFVASDPGWFNGCLGFESGLTPFASDNYFCSHKSETKNEPEETSSKTMPAPSFFWAERHGSLLRFPQTVPGCRGQNLVHIEASMDDQWRGSFGTSNHEQPIKGG